MRGGEEEQAERGRDMPYVPYLKKCAKGSLMLTDAVVSTQSAAVHEGARMDCAWSSIRSRTVHEWRPRPLTGPLRQSDCGSQQTDARDGDVQRDTI